MTPFKSLSANAGQSGQEQKSWLFRINVARPLEFRYSLSIIAEIADKSRSPGVSLFSKCGRIYSKLLVRTCPQTPDKADKSLSPRFFAHLSARFDLRRTSNTKKRGFLRLSACPLLSPTGAALRGQARCAPRRVSGLNTFEEFV